MKYFNIPAILILLFSTLCQAQKSQIEEKSISKHYASGMESKMILSKAEQWFTNEDNSEFYEIIHFDQNKGELIAEGSTNVLYKNIGKELYPKRSGMAEVLEAGFGNKIKIQTDNEGYMVTFEVIDMKKEMYKMEDLFFNCVNFKDIEEEDLMEYNDAMNKLLKANLVFKKRRNIFLENSRGQFEEVSSFLLNDGELKLFSVKEAVSD